MSNLNTQATATIQKRYNRIAFLYDLMEMPIERLRFAAWRTRLSNRIAGSSALEVGVGTGKNIPYYPSGVGVTAIDFSPRMLSRARYAARRRGTRIDLHEMDAQNLKFPDHAFDTVFATFVFCSVPDPVKGLSELRRVCKPGGRLLLMEHMRPGNFLFGLLFDALNPLVVRLTGANINRRTMQNIKKSGWKITVAQRLSLDVVWWIEATP